MHFYLTFGFLGFKVVKKQMITLFKCSEDFQIFKFYLVRLKSILIS